MMWAGSQDTPAATPDAALWVRHPWIFFTGFAVLHAAVFVAAIAWLARGGDAGRGGSPRRAGVGGAAGAAAAARSPRQACRSRWRRVRPGEWTVALRQAEAERSHRVLLQIDEPGRTCGCASASARAAPAPCNCRRGEHADPRRADLRSDPAAGAANFVARRPGHDDRSGASAGHPPRPARRPGRAGAAALARPPPIRTPSSPCSAPW